ncbi:MAG: aspartate kinase [Candidatus Daviesbacteria bacterium]|nr:aspartate kinase [Candidatus Daviesbacteria bacterium]
MERNGYAKDGNQESKAKPLLVMKFGGTSVGGSKPIKRVASLVEKYTREGNSLVVVVSAIRGVTNSLVEMGNFIKQNRRLDLELSLEDIFYRHLEVASNLNLPHPLRASLDDKIEELFFGLHSLALNLKETPPKSLDRILSYGERLNVPIVQAALSARGVFAEALDASKIIETDTNFGFASPNMERTEQHVKNIVEPMIEMGMIPVVTGFIGSTMYGDITTLGRGGSDYTASILGRVLGADEVWIWTDVDGVYSDDPRKNPNAQLLTELSQIKAHQMAMAGARVLYPKTVEPLIGTQTVLRVKNTFDPESPGTKIYIKQG